MHNSPDQAAVFKSNKGTHLDCAKTWAVVEVEAVAKELAAWLLDLIQLWTNLQHPFLLALQKHCAWVGWHCLQTIFYKRQQRLEHIPGILYSLPRIAPGQSKDNTERVIIKRCNKINSAGKSK